MAKRVKPLVLVVDDDAAHRLMIRTLLEDWGYEVLEAGDGEAAVASIRQGVADLVLMDMRMPKMDGIEASKAIHAYNPAIPIVVMTAYSSIPSAVEALKSGAYDYVAKPLDFDALKLVMERSLEHTRLQKENEGLRSQLAQLRVPDMIGRSPAMQSLIEMVTLVAPSEATVLITGESGTGKGLIARIIHANSSRSNKPLVEVNCAAIPETLIESELFGHEKGAFTGANRQRRGRFEQADGGTIFLDEVGEMSLPMQAKLLRVLQDGDMQRVGGEAVISVDVRVIAATNRNLQAMVAAGAFREDLYYRLNVVSIEAPSLRGRREDIPALAQHFLKKFAQKNHKTVKGITPRAMDILIRHSWPGNVRELENVIERAVILLRGESITPGELPLSMQQAQDSPPVVDFSGSDYTLADMEKQLILQVLEDTGGNKSETARRLGVTRRTLQLKLKKYEEEGGLPSSLSPSDDFPE